MIKETQKETRKNAIQALFISCSSALCNVQCHLEGVCIAATAPRLFMNKILLLMKHTKAWNTYVA